MGREMLELACSHGPITKCPLTFGHIHMCSFEAGVRCNKQLGVELFRFCIPGLQQGHSQNCSVGALASRVLINVGRELL